MLLPIGHYLGGRYRAETGDVAQEVRCGATFHRLTQDQVKVWAIAHGSSDALMNNVAWERTSVEEAALSAGVGDGARIVDELIDIGLLAEVAPGTDAALEFAKAHRLVPLMVGLGNAVDNPSMFDIGFHGQPILQVNATTYDLWQWSTMDDTLWATCQSAADVARRSTTSDPGRTDPDALLTNLLGSLHALLVRNAACLDIDFRLRWPEAA